MSADTATMAERVLTWLLSTVALEKIQRGLATFAVTWLHQKTHDWLQDLEADPPEDFVSVKITPPTNGVNPVV